MEDGRRSGPPTAVRRDVTRKLTFHVYPLYISTASRLVEAPVRLSCRVKHANTISLDLLAETGRPSWQIDRESFVQGLRVGAHWGDVTINPGWSNLVLLTLESANPLRIGIDRGSLTEFTDALKLLPYLDTDA